MNCCSNIWNDSPMNWIAEPEAKTSHQHPSFVVESVIAEYREACRAAEAAELDASGIAAKVGMTI